MRFRIHGFWIHAIRKKCARAIRSRFQTGDSHDLVEKKVRLDFSSRLIRVMRGRSVLLSRIGMSPGCLLHFARLEEESTERSLFEQPHGVAFI